MGDRHGENILFDSHSGEAMHVDFNCLFNKVRCCLLYTHHSIFNRNQYLYYIQCGLFLSVFLIYRKALRSGPCRDFFKAIYFRNPSVTYYTVFFNDFQTDGQNLAQKIILRHLFRKKPKFQILSAYLLQFQS